VKRNKEYRNYLADVRRTGYLGYPDQKQLAEWMADDKRREEILLAREAFLETLPETENVEIELNRKPVESVQPKNSDPFEPYLAALKHGHLWADGVAMEQIKKWEADPKYRPLIDQAKAEWKQRLNRIHNIKPLKPKRNDKLPPADPSDEDPSTLAFNAKILPSLETDRKTGSVYTEATLAATNLPGWADGIASLARAAHDQRHRQIVRKFFIELGKALKSGRALWDKTDELIFCNYHASTKFKKPLSQMTEEEGSVVVGLTASAYDKRLQRLGLKRKGGRPKTKTKVLTHRLS